MTAPCADTVSAPSRSARERILETAADLFYREGIRAVGVDTIIARSGVAKMSLYRNFPSKDDLVCAWLEDTRAQVWRWWNRVVSRHPGDPGEQLKAVFRSLDRWAVSPGFRGCPFLNTVVEYGATGHPGLAVADAHRRDVLAFFARLAGEAGAADPARLAVQLLVVMDGAYAAGSRAVHAPAAADTAAVLIDAAIPGQDRRC